MNKTQYDELTGMIAEALYSSQDTVEVDVNVLMDLLAKAEMRRYPIYVPYVPPEQSSGTTNYEFDKTTQIFYPGACNDHPVNEFGAAPPAYNSGVTAGHWPYS